MTKTNINRSTRIEGGGGGPDGKKYQIHIQQQEKGKEKIEELKKSKEEGLKKKETYSLIEKQSDLEYTGIKKEVVKLEKSEDNIKKKKELIETNTKIGESALAKIVQNKAKHNTAIGFESLNNMKQGNYNTALGSQTMINSNGNNNIKSNTAIGGKSLQNVKGGFNTAVGYESGNNIIGGSNNILIGKNSSSSDKKSNNEIVIGNDAIGKKDSAVIGNSSNISIEPGNNTTTLGTESNKFYTTHVSEISNGEVTIKLPKKKLKPGMLMLDEDGSLTIGDLKKEIAANSSKGDTILIEVGQGNRTGIMGNAKVFYKYYAYKYNEVTKKKGNLLKNWNGRLDVSKKYIFGRHEGARFHPFYISDKGPGEINSNKIKLNGDGSHTLGIKGNQRFTLEFTNNFLPTDKIYYFSTAQSFMKGELKLFSSNWNKLNISVVNGSEPKPTKNIIFYLVLDKDVPKGKSVILEYQTLDKQGTAIEGTHFTSTSGEIEFNGNLGEDSKQVEVPVLPNAVYEESKTVKIRFTDKSKVLTNTDKGSLDSTAEIIDNGPNPANEKYTLTVNNPTVKEGDDLVFNLKLNKKALTNISIDYAIVKNQTTLKEYKIVPFLNKDETKPVVRFNKGVDKAKLTVSTYRDGIYNNKNKKLMLQFTSSNFKNNYKPRASGTITEGDKDPSKRKYELGEYMVNPTVTEGEDLVFDLYLDQNPLTDILVNYAVVKKETTLKYDQYNLPYYKGEYAVLFKKDNNEAILKIPTFSDGKYDNINKKLVLQFTSSNFNSNYKPRLTGTVTEGDTNPADELYNIIRISEPEKSNAPNAVEGFPIIIQLELDKDALTDIDLYVNTTNGTASAGTHYEALKDKKITIKKGEKEKIFSIQTKSDKIYTGQDKKFEVKITGNNLNLDRKKECIIKEGDSDPSKKIYNLISSSPTVMEGDSGTKDLIFNLDIQEKALKDIKINYETIDSGSNKARKNIDYEYKIGSITIKEGQRKATIVVKVKGDTTYDNNGKNHLVYVKFSGQNINDRTFSGAIIENDESAEKYTYNNLKINGPEVTEGNTKMKFKLNLGEKARSKVIINYKTLNDKSSAEEGVDYVSKSGQLIFNEGKQESEFEITIKDDNVFEIEEKIVVQFSGNNIGTFSTFGIIKPDNDEDPNQAKPDLTTNGTSYNNNNGELSIKLNNTGNRDVIVNNNQQFNSLFEATINSSNRKDGTPEIKIGNKTYYVSKNDITYLKIKDHNFSTYFEKTDGININSSKNNEHIITLGSAPSGHNFWAVVNNPGLKKDDSIEFKIKASFKKNTTYIFMADDIKYDSVKESNESNNYFVFTPNKTITYEEPSSEYPDISGYNFVEENKDVFVSKMNGNLISLYVQHYPPPDYPEKPIAIKNISPSELKNNYLLVTKENDNFKQYQIVDYDEWGSGDTTEIYSDGYYYNIGTNPKYTGKDTETIYWYKK